MTERQNELLEFVKEQHGGQVRKYTGDPCHTHLQSVAAFVSTYEPNLPFGVEIALCHDLFEDTSCQGSALLAFLVDRQYAFNEARFIIDRVLELTDQYTNEAFPSLNRATRKKLEAHRLGQTHYVSQTVKCFDIIDNRTSIVEHDPNFAQVYLREAKILYSHLTGATVTATGLLGDLLKTVEIKW